MNTTAQIRHVIETYNINPVLAARIVYDVPTFSDADIQKYLNEKAKPFVKWVGGKRQLLSQFRDLNLYPPQKFNPLTNTYHEPFVGGGAVFFDLLPKTAHLNDFNDELTTTYTVIRDNVNGLIQELESGTYRYDKEVFLKIRSLNTLLLSPVERAARFIFLNRTAFNGMYRVNKRGEFNVPFGRYDNPKICDTENLNKVSKTLREVTISNGSYKIVLDKARKGDFIYFDPPYYPVTKTASFTTYTNEAFLEREQVELKDAFIELHNRGCFVMLSNSDTPFIQSLFAPFTKESIKIHKVQAGRAINSQAGKRGKINEVLVTNY